MAAESAPPDNSAITNEDPFKFDDAVRAAAWARQSGLCGFCGRNLQRIMLLDERTPSHGLVEAHHIISRQVGRPRAHVESLVVFVKSVDNCMYLCHECHLHNAHGHNFGSGGLRPPEDFPYSHGRQGGPARLAWVARAKAEWIQVFGDA